MPSNVVSVRVSEEQAKRLQRKARQLGRSTSETGAILLDEGLRRDEFAFIDFRDSPLGRQAYVQGSRLAVWQVLALARTYRGSVPRVAAHLRWPALKVQAALNYASAFPDEVENALRDSDAVNFDKLSHFLPQTERFVVFAKRKK